MSDLANEYLAVGPSGFMIVLMAFICLSAVGSLVWFLRYLVTSLIPKMLDLHKAELTKLRDDYAANERNARAEFLSSLDEQRKTLAMIGERVLSLETFMRSRP